MDNRMEEKTIVIYGIRESDLTIILELSQPKGTTPDYGSTVGKTDVKFTDYALFRDAEDGLSIVIQYSDKGDVGRVLPIIGTRIGLPKSYHTDADRMIGKTLDRYPDKDFPARKKEHNE